MSVEVIDMTTKQTLREIEKGGTSEMASAARSFINRPIHSVADTFAVKRLVADYEQYLHHLYFHTSNEQFCDHCEKRG